MRLPSAWVVGGLAAAVGAVVGGGVAALEAASRPWQAGDFQVATSTGTGPAPIAEVPETVFAFGTVGVGGKGTHEFIIRNSGNAPLELNRGATSCTCTVSDFEESEGGGGPKIVPPGGSTKLKVQWRGKGSGGPFRQQASVFTNDPRRPQIAFEVEGTVVPTFSAVPPTVTLSKLAASQSEQAIVKVFTFGAEPPRVDSLAVEDDKTAPFYSLASAPLDPAEVSATKGATGGFQITADIRPGLPIGPVRQTIKAVFHMPDEVTAEIPVEGSVTGDLALAGTAWDSSHETLRLGTVSSRSGTQASLFITVKGPHREQVRPVVRQVIPKGLEVVVGEGKPVGSGTVIRIPLSITIPPGSPPANHLCSPQAPAGKIVLDTGHPDSPELTIPVCVAIGP
jgi:hypothetical protein